MTRFVVGVLIVALAGAGLALGQAERKILSFNTEWMPLKVGARWIYQGMDPKEKVITTVERMEPIKRRVPVKGGSERTEYIESFIVRIVNGDKTIQEQLAITEDGIYRYSSGGKEITPPLKILKLPPAKGDTWSVQSLSEAIPLRGDFVVEDAIVNLPGKGPTPALVAKTRDFTVNDQKMEASYWFVPNLGIVKQHVKVGKFEMSTTLENFLPAAGAAPAPFNPLPNNPLPPISPPPQLEIK